MKKKTTILSAIVLVAVLIVAVLAYNELSNRVPPEGNLPESGATETGAEETAESDRPEVPDFTIADISGDEKQFSKFRGKPVVLNFWASWCPPCKEEMPVFEKVYQEKGSEIQFVMLALTDGGRETVETASSYVESQGYSFPVFFDVFQEGASVFGIQSIPTTFFIDENGLLADYIIGMLSESALRGGIENL